MLTPDLLRNLSSEQLQEALNHHRKTASEHTQTALDIEKILRRRHIAKNKVALTLKECQVLDLLLTGMSNAEIASYLTITEKRVKDHVTQIFKKKNIHSRTKLIVKEYEERIKGTAAEKRTINGKTENPLPVGICDATDSTHEEWTHV
jgi:DNA-binding NarL/FixJ family response regulator